MHLWRQILNSRVKKHSKGNQGFLIFSVEHKIIILSNNVLYIIVVFLKVRDCKKVDLNVQKLPKLGKHNFLADTSEVPAGVCLIDNYFNVILHVAAT